MGRTSSIIIKIFAGLLILISVIFVWRGLFMHAQVINESANFSALQKQYYTIAPDVRSKAIGDSDINRAFIKIQQYPIEIASLENVGLGMILAGLYLSALAAMLIFKLSPSKSKMSSRLKISS